MDKIEITPELLADIKVKAEKATPGPWCTCLTAEKVMGRKHPDWGCIYANVQSSKTGEILEGCQLAAVNQWLASEEEKDAAREKYFKEGIETNPGLMGANAEYIAAANPQVVLALIDKLEQLEEDFDTAARSAADESVKVVGLEKEAEWLAARVKCDNTFTPDQEAACVKANGPCAKCLREAARRAVKETENAG